MATQYFACSWPMNLGNVQSPNLHTACLLQLSSGSKGLSSTVLAKC